MLLDSGKQTTSFHLVIAVVVPPRVKQQFDHLTR